MQEPYITFEKISTIGTIVLILSQFIFLYNFINSLIRGKKAENNPWNAATLEWQTQSPPPHGNFSVPPVVYNGPYDYSMPDRAEDFIPQNVQSEKK